MKHKAAIRVLVLLAVAAATLAVTRVHGSDGAGAEEAFACQVDRMSSYFEGHDATYENVVPVDDATAARVLRGFAAVDIGSQPHSITSGLLTGPARVGGPDTPRTVERLPVLAVCVAGLEIPPAGPSTDTHSTQVMFVDPVTLDLVFGATYQ